MSADPRSDEELLDAARNGDEGALAVLVERHRDRLERMVELRMDRRLQGRIDPADVVQEAYLAVRGKFPHAFVKSQLPFFLWLRLEVGQKLVDVHRFHLATKMRDAGQEVSLHRGALPQVTSLSLAEHLLGKLTTASHAAMRAELKIRVQEALNNMDPSRSRGADSSALRGAEQRRDGPGSGHQARRRPSTATCGPSSGSRTCSRECRAASRGSGDDRQRPFRRPIRSAQIADEFVEAFRQGKRPSVEEFARRYPDHADEIRDMLPALVLMEKAKSADDAAGADGSGGCPGRRRRPLQQLGDYQILREVGRGGMGVVYEAQQLSLGRHVAIKVLPTHALLDPRQLGRFQREARSAARLHHTNIVPVFGVGEQDGLHYYVMQFIPGLGLDVVLDELRRLRQPRSKPAPTRGDAPSRPTNGTRDVSAVDVARGLLSGEFRRPEVADELRPLREGRRRRRTWGRPPRSAPPTRRRSSTCPARTRRPR